MGLGHFLRQLWRFFHPQWTAMTPKQINDIDRAVAESMANGSFTTPRHDQPPSAPTTPAIPPTPTADQLWTGAAVTESTYDDGATSSSEYSHPSMPRPVIGVDRPASAARLWSMSSYRSAGRVSVASSRGRDSGYAEQRSRSASLRSASLRKYNAWVQQQQQGGSYHYYPYAQQQQQQQWQRQQQWEGYDMDTYPYEDHQRQQQQQQYYDYYQKSRPRYPQATYYPEEHYPRVYGRPAEEEDGIVAGQPVNAPF